MPRASYRLQLRQGFGFEEAARTAPYLAELGVSHVYLSPLFLAAPGSTHGYDVADPNQVDDALGGEAGRRALFAELARLGLSVLLDVVPNHVSVAASSNRWWWDVLENGPHSAYAGHFDVDWEGPTELARSKVLLPILTEHYGRALEAGRIRLIRDHGLLRLAAMDRELPLSPPTLTKLLMRAADDTGSEELTFLADSLTLLSEHREAHPQDRRTRHQEAISERLVELIERDERVAGSLDRHIAELNADSNALDELVSQQYYRLAHYRIARYDLDYRRFFDINDLAALRMHHPAVFASSHELVLRWLDAGEISALRVDHPDGLRDPAAYFQRLRERRPGLWIVAEKILEPGEWLPEDWAVDGTTGYDFLNAVGGLFVDAAAEQPLTELYAAFTAAKSAPDFQRDVRICKRLVLDELLASDVQRSTQLFQGICASKRRHRDFAAQELRQALCEVIVELPVYRTYVTRGHRPTAEELARVQKAVSDAQRERPELDAEVLGLLEELLSGKCLSELEWEFVGRFQQLSSAAMAKGLEDTSFYRYARLLALNEVGGDPGRFGTRPEEFHAFSTRLQAAYPLTQLATSTHDTKRGEDARLRLAALSEFSGEWADAVRSWSSSAARHRTPSLADPNVEYYFWQTLIAAHPVSEERLAQHLTKAMREAKLSTSWLNVREDYERAVQDFARGVLSDREIMSGVERFVARLLPVARRSSLSQTLLKLTAAGVPDLYQGTELWDTSLTDPDNRRRVDFAERARLLEEARRMPPSDAFARLDDGLAKLYLITRTLALRARSPEGFGAEASYHPLAANGREAERVVAFQRGSELVVVAPRLWRRVLEAGWGDTELELPPGRFRHWFVPDFACQGRVGLSELLASVPVAILVRETSA